jgi:outer membrane scaffolding protein for murein synthesis (MipA/OmpV family)
MTGMIFELLKTVWTGKLTYRKDAYWLHELMVLLSAQGANAARGATLFARTAPFRTRTAITATMMARKRFEKTQNAALGKRPSGAWSLSVPACIPR